MMPEAKSGDDSAVLCDEGAEWLRAFERKHGRKLRVLHIGNIANNAYINGKIQRDRGIEADVLSFDYYHIMACPEWEDSGFSGDVGDPMKPDWWAVDLKGYRRPRWFVSGPLDASLRYLMAKTSDHKNADRLWRLLALERWMLSRRSRMRDAVAFAIRVVCGQYPSYPGSPVNSLLMRSAGQWIEAIGRQLPFQRSRIVRRLRTQGRRLSRFGRTAHLYLDQDRHLQLTCRRHELALTQHNRLLKQLGRKDVSENLDFFFKWWWHPYIGKLFRRYDVVQCYATYTAMPFILGMTRYAAYEHGTIRSIPFTATDEGRMCMASYRAAASVFITNLDNLEAAEKMRLDPCRVVCLPHACDSDAILRFISSAVVPLAGDKTVTFLMPSRQHWVDQDPSWAKGNDRVFAALRLLKDAGQSCVLRAVEWGNDVEASRARIAELGVEEMVEWLSPMKKKELWLEYLKCNAVVDQFSLPAFGTVTVEAMMCGRRVITRIDKVRAAQFFGTVPPLLNCSTPAEIAEAMTRVIKDPADIAGEGRAIRDWMQRYHSAERIVALQLGAYQRILKMPEPPATKLRAKGELDPARLIGWLRVLRPFYVARPWRRTTSGNEIVMLVVSALRIDSRVERAARVLAGGGWRVRIIAPDISTPSFADQPWDWGPNVTFHLLPLPDSAYVMKPPWLVGEAMYEAAAKFRPFAFHCHDLNTALIGLRAAREIGARWFCDFHEWTSENVTWSEPNARWEPHDLQKRLLCRWAERLAVRLADQVITVNDSIARELEGLGRAPLGTVKVVRNIPLLSAVPTRDYPPLKQQLGLPEGAFVVLYQGGTGPTRLLEPAIEALALAPEVTLVIRGPSLDLFGERYKALAASVGASERLVLMDGVPSCDVVAAARGADAGMYTVDDLCKSFTYALPNKVFEYLAAGVPLLVADHPEVRRLAEDVGVGLVFDPRDPASIAAQMRRLAQDPQLVARLRAPIAGFLAGIDAAGEWERLVEMYANLRDKEIIATSQV